MVGIEYIKILRRYKELEEQIYPDAADFGFILTGDIVSEKQIMSAIYGLQREYLFYKKLWGSQKIFETGGMSITFWIPVSCVSVKTYGQKITISYNRDAHMKQYDKRVLRFISINEETFITDRPVAFFQNPTNLRELTQPLL